MYVYFHLRVRIQDHTAQLTVQFHRIQRIRLSASSCFNLKCLVFLRVHFSDIFFHIFFQLFKSIVLQTHNRADSYDTKHSFQTFHSLFVIVFAFTVHIHSPLCFVYIKFSVHILQCKTDLTHQSVFKQIPVLSFDPDFSVFNQK